jgi:hypothetical protein
LASNCGQRRVGDDLPGLQSDNAMLPLHPKVTMQRIDELLEKTSRTFALSIPLLPQPTRRQLGVAYLLFRIADTFEDAVDWPNDRRIAALREFEDLLKIPEPVIYDWLLGRGVPGAA